MPPHVYVTVWGEQFTTLFQKQYNANIRVCAVYLVAYNAGLHKGCFYKVGQF